MQQPAEELELQRLIGCRADVKEYAGLNGLNDLNDWNVLNRLR
jgi:hypothetical protein